MTDNKAIIIENDYFHIEVDGKSGAIIGIRNCKTNTEYIIPQNEPKPPFIIDSYSANQAIYIRDPYEKQSGGFSLYNPDEHSDQKGDLDHLRDPIENGVKIWYEKNETNEKIKCSYVLPGGIHLSYSITVKKDSPIAEWKIWVDNKGGETPNKDQRVYRVAFPVIEGLSIGGSNEDDFLARPYAQGELIPDPVSYEFTRPGKWNTPIYVLTYIGWASMPWLDLYDQDGGIYLASYDPTFQQIDLESFPDRSAGTMTLDIRTYSFLEPGESWESQTFAIGVHEGDWHWAADQYREWAHKHHRPYIGPDWVRKDCDGWFGTGGPMRYEEYPRMLKDAQWLGLNYLQIWSEMLENVGPNKERKAYYCFLLPDPDRGGEIEMVKAVKAVRDSGGHIGFYHNIWTWDSEVDKGLEQWRDYIPPDVKIPRWWEDFRKSASVFPDGSRQAGNFVDGYSGMCPASEAYQDYVISWVIDRYVKLYGVDTWYFDSMPVTMFGASRICFSDEHGPCQPHGIGRGCLEILQKVTDLARTYANLAITTETVSDALMQYNSHALGIELVGGLTKYPHPEIYTYTFPEHPIFSGSCNNQEGLIYYYDDLEKPTREEAMNRVFLMGYRFDIMIGRINENDLYHQYLKKLITLRQKIKSDVYESDFRDTIGLGELPKNVYAKLFRQIDRNNLIVTLLDRRKDLRESFNLSIDLLKNDLSKAKDVILYLLDGNEINLQFQETEDGILKLAMPSFDSVVSAILIKF
ncbi:MAG: hypothetical protein QG588_302 [Candidatus Poribacteria bacterium]|nr:hypothetical protein [Candidatus Poribacteria bacterium]